MFLRMTVLFLLTRMMTIIPTFFSEDSRRITYKVLSKEPETSKKNISQLILIVTFLYFFIVI